MTVQRILAVALVPYAAWLVVDYDYHFIDGVNLAFHEAGHMFLLPFGQVLHMLGGTFGQLLVPLLCAGHFAREGRSFEPWVCLCWLGESLMYTAYYMADAGTLALPLAGGGIHDWNWIFRRWGGLAHCRTWATGTHVVASLLVIGSTAAALRIAFSSSGSTAPSPSFPGTPPSDGSSTRSPH